MNTVIAGEYVKKKDLIDWLDTMISCCCECCDVEEKTVYQSVKRKILSGAFDVGYLSPPPPSSFTNEDTDDLGDADLEEAKELIRKLVAEQEILERLGFNLSGKQREAAVEALVDYVLRLLDWQYPGTILDEIFDTYDEIEAVTEMINESLRVWRNDK